MSRFFFVDDIPAANSKNWQGPSDLVRHIRALRLAAGSEVVLLPHSGDGVAAELLENGDFLIKATVKRPVLKLPDISVASAWPKGSRGDDLVRRATELGAKRIVPLSCERSVVGRHDLSASKVKRWDKISKEVCQQCRRPDLPIFDSKLLKIEQLQQNFSEHTLICLSPGAKPLQQVLAASSTPLMLVIGPEGGLSQHEEQQLIHGGAQLASIGPTILRIEAAVASALAIAGHCLQSK